MRAVLAAECYAGENVFFIARNYDTDRNLPVIRAVGGVKSPASRIKADFAAEMAAQSRFQRGSVEFGARDRRWGDILRHSVRNIFEDADVIRKCGAEAVLRAR